MRDFKEIERDTLALTAEMNRNATELKLKKISDSLATRIAQSEADKHAEKSAAFAAYQESLGYINSLKADIVSNGTETKNEYTGAACHLKMNTDGTTARTFDNYVVGSTHEIAGRINMIKSFEYSITGSAVELLPLSKKAFLVGEKVTPFSGISVAFNSRTNRLTTAKLFPLQSDAILNIDGIQYIPKSIYGTSADFHEYELEVL